MGCKKCGRFISNKNEHSCPTFPVKEKFSKDVQLKICGKYEEGNSIEKLAQEYDCSPHTIHRILKKHNINRRTRGEWQVKELKKGYKKLTKEKVRIITHLVCDGSVSTNGSRYGIHYWNNNKSLINQFINDFRITYGLKMSVTENKHKKYPTTYHVQKTSKLALKDLLEYGKYRNETKFFKPLLNLSKEKTAVLLRSAFDDEGSVNPSKKTIVFVNNSKVLKEQIKELLSKFNITSKDHGDLEITKKSNIKRFKKEVNFSKKVYVSKSSKYYGKTKRDVLNLLLNSYKRK